MAVVPDELMARLHEANEQLRRAKAMLDKAEMFNTPESRAAATALRAAEEEIEAVTVEINACLLPVSKGGGAGKVQ